MTRVVLKTRQSLFSSERFGAPRERSGGKDGVTREDLPFANPRIEQVEVSSAHFN